jgi:tRNA modification GTPase
VEQIGIERTFKAIEQADLVLMVCDNTMGWTQDDEKIAQMLENKPHIILANKCDLKNDIEVRMEFANDNLLPGTTDNNRVAKLAISAKVGTGIPRLNDLVEAWVFRDERSHDAGASLNARQGELCTRAVEALRLVETTVSEGMPQDCLSTDLKQAVDCLSEICGQAVSEEIITNVFATFCIGK